MNYLCKWVAAVFPWPCLMGDTRRSRFWLRLYIWLQIRAFTASWPDRPGDYEKIVGKDLP